MKFKGRMTATIVRSSKIAAATDATSARTTISAYGRSATHPDCLQSVAFPDQPGQMMSDNTVSNFFTHGNP